MKCTSSGYRFEKIFSFLRNSNRALSFCLVAKYRAENRFLLGQWWPLGYRAWDLYWKVRNFRRGVAGLALPCSVGAISPSEGVTMASRSGTFMPVEWSFKSFYVIVL